jgi:hypothetical protein
MQHKRWNRVSAPRDRLIKPTPNESQMTLDIDNAKIAATALDVPISTGASTKVHAQMATVKKRRPDVTRMGADERLN